MNNLYPRLKKYIVLVRAYSIIDVLLLLLFARTLAGPPSPVRLWRAGPPGGSSFHILHDYVAAFVVLSLWAVLTLMLEAKHKHAYRESIRYAIPIFFLVIASAIMLLINPRGLPFIGLVWLFTRCYIKKETNQFWGMTSSVWRGLYQAVLFFACLSLYRATVGLPELVLGGAIACLYFSRNLIADVRDVAFDRLTLVVFWGSRFCYLLTLISFLIGGTIFLFAFPSPLVILPVIVISLLLLVYDDGFMLHRLSITVTSFVFVNATLYLKGASLIYPNLLFLGILSNFVFYEKVARPSNPIPQVPHQARFLFRKPKS